jgi:DNA-binding FadR family transcriptional regulator
MSTEDEASPPDGAPNELLTAEALSLEALPPIPKNQLYEKISGAIIEQIRVGVMVPGQRLPSERALAAAFGVSRPSLREALGALQMLGVVRTRHGSGSWIAANALDLVANRTDGEFDLGVSPLALLEARATIEPAIAELAARRFVPDPEIHRLLEMMNKAREWGNPVHRATWSDADRLYHQRLAVHTQNAVLVAAADFIASVQAQRLWRQLRDDTLAVPGRISKAVEEHEQIFEAISNGRPEDAAEAARDHIQAVRNSMDLE